MQRAELATVDPRRRGVVKTNVESPGDRPGSTSVQLRTEAPHPTTERGEMPFNDTRIRPRRASATSQDTVSVLRRGEPQRGEIERSYWCASARKGNFVILPWGISDTEAVTCPDCLAGRTAEAEVA